MYKAWFSGLTQTEAQSKEMAKEQARREAIDEAILKALASGSLNQHKLIQKVKELAPKAPIPHIRTAWKPWRRRPARCRSRSKKCLFLHSAMTGPIFSFFLSLNRIRKTKKHRGEW